jgi:preprotein translocase subunit SecG
MSDTNLLIISIVVFCLLIIGLYLMVREFMGEVSDAFPDVNEWLNTDKKKKK